MTVIYESIADDIIAKIDIWPGSKKRRDAWANNWVAVAQRYAPEGWTVLSIDGGEPRNGVMTAIVEVDEQA